MHDGARKVCLCTVQVGGDLKVVSLTGSDLALGPGLLALAIKDVLRGSKSHSQMPRSVTALAQLKHLNLKRKTKMAFPL